MNQETVSVIIAAVLVAGMLLWCAYAIMAYNKMNKDTGRYRVFYLAQTNRYLVQRKEVLMGIFFSLPDLVWDTLSQWNTKEEALAELQRLKTAVDHEVTE